MIEAAEPNDEAERLNKLESYNILDSLPEQLFDDITHIASQICQMPISLISFVDKDRQWFKSKVGLDACQTPRSVAFCSHAILGEELFYIPDATKDERFYDNPLVADEPHVVFYAGAPIVTPDGKTIGTVCVIDSQPRQLSEEQKNTLKRLSRQVSIHLEHRIDIFKLEESQKRLKAINEELKQFSYRTSHDLKAPITTSKRILDYMKTDIADGKIEEALRNGDKVTDQLSSLEVLIGDITSLVRSEVNYEQTELVNLTEVLNEVEVRLNLLAQENNCRIDKSILGQNIFKLEKIRRIKMR